MGTNSTASQDGAIAIGATSQATGRNAIAIGSNAVATGSVAVGVNARASNGGAAFGGNAVATGENSSALGPGATATAPNSVAIGSGSVNTAANTVTGVKFDNPSKVDMSEYSRSCAGNRNIAAALVVAQASFSDPAITVMLLVASVVGLIILIGLARLARQMAAKSPTVGDQSQ